MRRWTLNISFKTKLTEKQNNIIEKFKTLRELNKYTDIIDETVCKASVKDNATGRVIWLKK